MQALGHVIGPDPVLARVSNSHHRPASASDAANARPSRRLLRPRATCHEAHSASSSHSRATVVASQPGPGT